LPVALLGLPRNDPLRGSFGSAVTALSRPAAVAPSRIEQNRDDQDESVQGILVAGADQRRVRRMKSTRVMRDSG
jgi:hypothetical protein